MKFVVTGGMKEPWEENMVKAIEIEKKRSSIKMLTPIYFSMGSPRKSFVVFECEPEEMMKWSKDYGVVLNAKVTPVMTREEWAKL